MEVTFTTMQFGGHSTTQKTAADTVFDGEGNVPVTTKAISGQSTVFTQEIDVPHLSRPESSYSVMTMGKKEVSPV